ncbi:unnamed protein product [Vicia faba]|uniref:Uncharacterized protein n=1 Tax=Vicia faba TaxID=3906 RepID=A0AAV1B1S9_VICFA|nr:unnamed protein product [Vicia faba]
MKQQQENSAATQLPRFPSSHVLSLSTHTYIHISFPICGGGLQADLQHELSVDGDCDVVWKAWLVRVRQIRLQIWVWLAWKNGRKVAVGMMCVDERRGSGHAMGGNLIESPSPYYFLLRISNFHTLKFFCTSGFEEVLLLRWHLCFLLFLNNRNGARMM